MDSQAGRRRFDPGRPLHLFLNNQKGSALAATLHAREVALDRARGVDSRKQAA